MGWVLVCIWVEADSVFELDGLGSGLNLGQSRLSFRTRWVGFWFESGSEQTQFSNSMGWVLVCIWVEADSVFERGRLGSGFNTMLGISALFCYFLLFSKNTVS